jgi:hypothetical protein
MSGSAVEPSVPCPVAVSPGKIAIAITGVGDRKLGHAAYADLRKRGVSDAEIQKAIAKKPKPRRSKNA